MTLVTQIHAFHVAVHVFCPTINYWTSPVSWTLPSAAVRHKVQCILFRKALEVLEMTKTYLCMRDDDVMPRNNIGSEEVRALTWAKERANVFDVKGGINSLVSHLELFNRRTIEKYVFCCPGTSTNHAEPYAYDQVK